jgi:hypothetical protein
MWGERDLYAMLLKRIANADPQLASYLKAAKSVEWQEDPDLGLIPILSRWDDARPAIERMVGPYMGANQKRGWFTAGCWTIFVTAWAALIRALWFKCWNWPQAASADRRSP